MTIADRIYRRRCELGLTQRELANRSRCTVATISAAERGDSVPRYHDVQERIARALGIPLEEFRRIARQSRKREAIASLAIHENG